VGQGVPPSVDRSLFVVSLLETRLAHPVLLGARAACSRQQHITLPHSHPVCVPRTLYTGVAAVFASSENIPLVHRHLHVLGCAQFRTEGVLDALSVFDEAPLGRARCTHA